MIDDELIDRSAAPEQVRLGLTRLVEADPDLAGRLGSDDGLDRALVAVMGASRSLITLLETDPRAVEQLAALDRRDPVDAGSTDALRAWKRREYLRIAARDLLEIDDLEATGDALSRMAGDVLAAAGFYTMTADLAIIGMGKLAGSELNYASDVDVLFVGEGLPEGLAEQAREIVAIATTCFRVDTELRPEGPQGPLVRDLESYEAYWDRWAEAWEFQALLKARPVAGNTWLGDRFAEAAAATLWSRRFSSDDIAQIRDLKRRVEDQVATKGLTDREVKRGPGGIRDVEFAVQLLQLVHGGNDPTLRNPNTLTSLTELAAGGYIDEDDAALLADSYRFLRKVEHRLQLVDERQTHVVPSDTDARQQLARVMGFTDLDGRSLDGSSLDGRSLDSRSLDSTALEAFDAELIRHRARVRSIYERLYFRPLLEAFTGRADRDDLANPLQDQLKAFGFVDAERTRIAVRELTSELRSSSRLMEQLLPLLLTWLSESPNPDLGLLELRHLVSSSDTAEMVVTAFRDSPELARRVCVVLGTSRLLADAIRRNPDLVISIGELDETPRDLDRGAIEATDGWRDDPADFQARLRRFKERELLLIGAADVLGLLEPDEVGTRLTQLAETVVTTAIEAIEPELPFAAIAMGRFGGGQLSYASDLDLVFVYDGAAPEDHAEAEAVVRRLRDVIDPRPAARIYEVDLDLRPEGRNGPLAKNLNGYRIYYERWAEPWERLAMVRARPVGGDPALGRGFLATLAPYVWGEDPSVEVVDALRHIKARVERERIPRNEDPEFHLKLGPGSLSDIEFTVQLRQLETGGRGQATLPALDNLVERGFVDPEDAEVLREAYAFCTRARDRLYLIRGRPGDALPTESQELRWLANSLATTPRALRTDYQRVTRRARAVVERLFYGRTDDETGTSASPH